MSDKTTCTECKASIHPLEVFPGPLCLKCYAKQTEEVTIQEHYETIMRVFGGKK